MMNLALAIAHLNRMCFLLLGMSLDELSAVPHPTTDLRFADIHGRGSECTPSSPYVHSVQSAGGDGAHSLDTPQWAAMYTSSGLLAGWSVLIRNICTSVSENTEYLSEFLACLRLFSS